MCASWFTLVWNVTMWLFDVLLVAQVGWWIYSRAGCPSSCSWLSGRMEEVDEPGLRCGYRCQLGE